MTSRIAALPTPSTYGSFAVYDELVEQRRVEAALEAEPRRIGRAGNGTVRQSANAKSVLGIDTTPLFTPVGLSLVAEMSVAFVVSRLAGVRSEPGE